MTAGETQPRSRIASLALVGVFLAACMLPGVTTFWMGDAEKTAATENRRAAAAPAFPTTPARVARFPAEFDLWFQDAYGLRRFLVIPFHHLMVLGLGVSPAPNLLVGKDRWVYFLAGQGLEMARGTARVSELKIELWARAILARRDAAAERGYAYAFGLIPGKLGVYADHLPFPLDPVAQTALSRLEARVQALDPSGPMAAIQTALTEERDRPGASGNAFYARGVHWTDRGALAAYRTVLGTLARQGLTLTPWELADYEPTKDAVIPDSWAGRLYLEGVLPVEEFRLAPLRKRKARRVSPGGKVGEGRQRWTREAETSEAARLVLGHDSFGRWIIPMLVEHFALAETQRGSLVEIERLDPIESGAVIELFTELFLLGQPPPFPTECMQQGLLASLDAGGAKRILNAALTGPLDELDSLRGLIQQPLASGSALEVTVTAAGNLLLLPALPKVQPGHAPLLILDLESPFEHRINVGQRRNVDEEFNGNAFSIHSNAAGRRRIALPLAGTGQTGTTGLRLSAQPGRFVLHGLEVWSVPLDQVH